MKISPLDVRQKRFEASFRGYSKKEVEGFLELVASEFEEVVRANIALKDDLKRALDSLEGHLERQKALQETMVTAQRVSEDVRAQANKEAAARIAEAELQAEKILATANQRLVGLSNDIVQMKGQKVQFESHLESLIESHRKLLETWKSRVPEVTLLLKKAKAE